MAKPATKPELNAQAITQAAQPKPVSAPASIATSAASAVEKKAAPPEADSDEVTQSPTPSTGKKLAALPRATLPLKTFAWSGPFKTYDELCEASLLDLNEWLRRKEQEKDGLYEGMGEPGEGLEKVCPKQTKAQNEAADGYMGYANEIMRDDKLSEGPYQRLTAPV